MGFIQIIEYKTSRIEECQAVVEKYRASGGGTAIRGTVGKDRDQADTYLSIVEFPSWEAAQENSNRPETAQMSQEMMALCDGPPSFRNLEVIYSD